MVFWVRVTSPTIFSMCFQIPEPGASGQMVFIPDCFLHNRELLSYVSCVLELRDVTCMLYSSVADTVELHCIILCYLFLI